MSRHSCLRILLGLTLLAAAGCAGERGQLRAARAWPVPRGVVFVADGAGDSYATTNAMQQALEEEGVPLNVRRFPWSHGPRRVFADQTDEAHAREQGECLATEVAALRRQCPGAAVYLVAHSAGSTVVLAAAEALPCGTVDRLVLLGPAVSADYDLRPALRACREGIDVFHSRRDVAYLGVGVALLGTADRRWLPAAGRVGFCPLTETQEDAVLYARLHQHPWDPSVAWTGNHGGHFESYRPAFLRAYVLPLLQGQPLPR